MSTLEDDINKEYEELKSLGKAFRVVEYATDVILAASAGMVLSYDVVDTLTHSTIFPTGYAAIMFCAGLLRCFEGYMRHRQQSYMNFLKSVHVVEEYEENDFFIDKSGYEGWLDPNDRSDW